MEWIAQPEIWIALLTLTAIEIVLGIDNVIFLFLMAFAFGVEMLNLRLRANAKPVELHQPYR